MKTQWVWMFLWSNAMDFWNYAYEANNGFKKQCNWFRGMLIDNTFDLKLCLWSNAINLEQFLWNAMNLEICLDVDSIVELCLWINTIDFELCLQSNTMDLQQHNGFGTLLMKQRIWFGAVLMKQGNGLGAMLMNQYKVFGAMLLKQYNGFELCLWAT